MTTRFLECLLAGLLLCSAWAAYAGTAECDQPRTSEAVARCLGNELRAADASINQSYQTLMRQLSEGERTSLRAEQRAWIKERDAVCNLNTRETNREAWYEALLSDYRKTVCVVRYTRTRTAQLEQMQGKLAAGARQAREEEPKRAEAPVSSGKGAYQIVGRPAREKGRWYYEVTLRMGDIARLSPTAVWIGCGAKDAALGGLMQVRASEQNTPPVRVGIALDLEDGKFYVREDGAWVNGEPGTAKGLDAKLGRRYQCGIDSTALVAPMTERGLLQVNFGEQPFAYSMPPGYRPFGEI